MPNTSDDIVQAVERRLAEIEESLREHDEMVAERDRLQRFLSELTGARASSRTGGASTARAGRPARSRSRGSAPAQRRSSGSGTRRPRGQNREAVLQHLSSAGEANAASIADATGIGRSVIYSLLGRLADKGTIERREADGQTVYTLPGGH